MTTPLILLHGALGSAEQMSGIESVFSDHRPTHCLNLPGHGGIPATGPFSMKMFEEALLRFLDEKKLDQVSFFGYSMGGYVALWFAWKHPERVQSIITLGTKLAWTPETAAGMQRMFDAEKIALKAPQMAEHLARVHTPLDWKLLCRQTADFLHDLGAGKGIPDHAYPNIGCPVVIGRGTADHVVSAEECAHMARLIPDCRVQELSEVPHVIEQIEANSLQSAVDSLRQLWETVD